LQLLCIRRARLCGAFTSPEDLGNVRFVLQPSDPDIFVTDETGRDVYWVKGPTGRVGRWTLRDLAGGEVAAVRQHGGPFLHRFGIYQHERPIAELREEPGRQLPRAVAALRNALAGTPPRISYTIDVAGRTPLRIDSDAMALEYAFTREGRPAATVSAYWLASSGTWGVTVTVADANDAVVVLAATATIEIGWGRMGQRSSRRSRVASRR
jgi:uncharacterized protein YxjI